MLVGWNACGGLRPAPIAEQAEWLPARRPTHLKHLILRALGMPGTTPAMPGAETERMVAALRIAMTPYFRNGPIVKKHATLGLI